MILGRRRYYFWLLKAYFKRWKKTILLSLLIGGISFFVLLWMLSFYIFPFVEKKTVRIGYWGSYTVQTLPEEVMSKISYGLTSVGNNGEVRGAAASSWEVKDDGKTYIFHLRKHQYFHTGEELTSSTFRLDFQDVTRKNSDTYQVVYTLKKPYAPFLATVTKPILLKGFSGLGEYKVVDVELNAGFVKSISLQGKKDGQRRETIYFYPTERALKIAFALGEIDQAVGLSNLDFREDSFMNWKRVTVTKTTSYEKLVVLFYNNSDTYLSNKKLRQSLNYALPAEFEFGERAYSQFPPHSMFFHRPLHYTVPDREMAKTLLASSDTNGNDLTLSVSVGKNYRKTAEEMRDAWRKIGVKSNLQIVDEIPIDFQILILPLNIPKDPDQYTLWHSAQKHNISHYKNLRIDKLLEDGRLIHEVTERVKIYSDLQKYLLDDVPASFLYFPYEYSIRRS